DRSVGALSAIIDRDGDVVDVQFAVVQRVDEEGQASKVGIAIEQRLVDRVNDLNVAHAFETSLVFSGSGQIANRGQVGAVVGGFVEEGQAERVSRTAEESDIYALDGSHVEVPLFCKRRLSVGKRFSRVWRARQATTVLFLDGTFRAIGSLPPL